MSNASKSTSQAWSLRVLLSLATASALTLAACDNSAQSNAGASPRTVQVSQVSSQQDQPERNESDELQHDHADHTSDEVDHDHGRTKPVQEQVDSNLPPGGKIVFDKMELDFGKVSLSEELKGVFRFTNTGDEPLTIGKISTSCGCTVAKLEKKVFQPGEGDEIEITYNPKGAGKSQRLVTVHTSDESNPSVRLTVAAEVVPFLTIEPRNLTFGSVMNHSEHVSYLTVVSKDPKMKVEDIVVRGQFITAELIEEKEGMSTYPPSEDLPGRAVIKVVLQPDAPRGYIRGNLTVTAKAAFEPGEEQRMHNVNVLISGQIVGDLQVTPNFLRYAVLDKDEDFTGEVVISSRTNKPFNIVETKLIETNIEGLELTTEPYENGEIKGYRIVLAGNTGNHRGAFRGTVAIITDREDERETEVRFMGAVRQPIVRPAAPTPGLQRPATPPAQPGSDKES